MNNKVVLFKNWTNEDFKWKWDSLEYEFKSQSITPLPEYLFNHFAKHLSNRELNKLNRPIYLEDPILLEMIEKCRYQEKEVNLIESEIIKENVNQIKEESKKRGRPKKEIKEVKQSSEENFEGLENLKN